MTYPYLGIKRDGEKVCVILFTNPGIGVVVHSDLDDQRFKFGKNASFNEDDFDFYPEGQTVILMN